MQNFLDGLVRSTKTVMTRTELGGTLFLVAVTGVLLTSREEGANPTRRRLLGALRAYSTNLAEVEFCELRLYGVLRSSASGVPAAVLLSRPRKRPRPRWGHRPVHGSPRRLVAMLRVSPLQRRVSPTAYLRLSLADPVEPVDPGWSTAGYRDFRL